MSQYNISRIEGRYGFSQEVDADTAAARRKRTEEAAHLGHYDHLLTADDWHDIYKQTGQSREMLRVTRVLARGDALLRAGAPIPPMTDEDRRTIINIKDLHYQRGRSPEDE